MWVLEGHPHPPESWHFSKHEFSGVLRRFSQASPKTWRDAADLLLTALVVGTSSLGYGNLTLTWSTWSVPSATFHLSPPPTGKAYSLGRAEYGRLGLGEGAEEKSIPTLISRLPAVSSVACGASVGYAVTKDGK